MLTMAHISTVLPESWISRHEGDTQFYSLYCLKDSIQCLYQWWNFKILRPGSSASHQPLGLVKFSYFDYFLFQKYMSSGVYNVILNSLKSRTKPEVKKYFQSSKLSTSSFVSEHHVQIDTTLSTKLYGSFCQSGETPERASPKRETSFCNTILKQSQKC